MSSRSGSRRTTRPLAKDSLSPVCRGSDVQVDVEHALKRGLAVVDGDVVAVGVQPGGPRRLRDALPDAHQVGDGLRRGVGQVDGVALRDDQGVAADERPDVEDGQVVVVLVDADGWGLAGDDGAEHTGHPPR